MLNKIPLIKEINKSCQGLFQESSFRLHPSSVNRFKLTGDYTSKAINNYNNTLEEVDVIKWFDNFWVYIDIRFEDQNTFISLSVFQGEAEYELKHQLFRAEWDDYNNKEERHPQPHWHITANQVIEKTFEEFAAMDVSETFLSMLKEEKSKVIDVNKIHFAMNANWSINRSDIHSLNNEEEINKWFFGLLSHLKDQLDYASNS